MWSLAGTGPQNSSCAMTTMEPPLMCGLLDASLQVEGVQGIMAAYASTLNHVGLAGPTLFGPVINNAGEIAGQSLSCNSCKYFVFLIITV